MPKEIIPQNILTKEVAGNRKIVQHNDLITSVSKMDKVPLKIFEMAVASLDVKNIPKDRTVHVSKELLLSFFEGDSNSKPTRFKIAVTKIHQQAVFSMREMSEKKGKYEYKTISPIETTSWNDYTDLVSFKFTESIMPYLIDLSTNFTQYLLTDIAKLNSKYSIVIYKWLSMNFNQYDHYLYKGNRSQKQLQEFLNPEITIKELRRLTDTEGKYSHFPMFEKRILKVVEKEITENTNYNVSYEKISKGRTIESILFHIEKKPVVADITYKEEQDDPLYLKSLQEKEQEQQRLYTQSMQSPYTKELIANLFISPMEMTDIDLMANLQKKVYPNYDKLKELRGFNGVKDHISYVASKQEPYSKRNIVKYLFKAIESYLVTVKSQNIE